MSTLRQPGELMEQEDLRDAPEDGQYRGRTAFWVRQSRIADDLDRRLLAALIDWFGREWAFFRMVFYTSTRDERQQRILAEAGLLQRYIIEQRDSEGQLDRWGCLRKSMLRN